MNSKFVCLLILTIFLKIGQNAVESTRTKIRDLLQKSRDLSRQRSLSAAIPPLPGANKLPPNRQISLPHFQSKNSVPPYFASQRMDQRSRFSPLAVYSHPFFAVLTKQPFFLTKMNKFTLRATLPSMHSKISSFSTNSNKMVYTEKDVERYYLRNNLKTEWDALKEMNGKDFVEFRNVFGSKWEIEYWEYEDEHGPPPRENEAHIFWDMLPKAGNEKGENGEMKMRVEMPKLTKENVEEYLEKKEKETRERRNRWREEVEIDGQKIKVVKENRERIFVKALEFAIGQMRKLDGKYWAEGSGVDLSGLPREEDKELHKMLEKFMQRNLTMEGNKALFDAEFRGNCLSDQINLEFCLEYLGKIKEIVETKMPNLHKKLQEKLIEQELGIMEMAIKKRKTPIQAALMDIELFELHFEMAELGLKAAILAKQATEDESKLGELAKMKYFAKKLRVVQMIMGNVAYGGARAFGYTEDEDLNKMVEYENKKGELGSESAQFSAQAEIRYQLNKMGFLHRIDGEWAERMKAGEKGQIEEFMGREIMTKSEQKVIGHAAKIFLMTDKWGAEAFEEFM